MVLGKIVDIFGAIVTVALAFVLVSSKNTASIISSFGTAFSGSLKASMGK
jgi:hypothetical protein